MVITLAFQANDVGSIPSTRSNINISMKNLINNIVEFLKAYYEVFLVNYDIRWKRPSEDINKKRK